MHHDITSVRNPWRDKGGIRGDLGFTVRRLGVIRLHNSASRGNSASQFGVRGQFGVTIRRQRVIQLHNSASAGNSASQCGVSGQLSFTMRRQRVIRLRAVMGQFGVTPQSGVRRCGVTMRRHQQQCSFTNSASASGRFNPSRPRVPYIYKYIWYPPQLFTFSGGG